MKLEKRYDADLTTAKERVSRVKVRSLISLVAGQRASHFDALLAEVPTSFEMTALAMQLKKPDIKSTIFDLDGNLVAPYAQIPKEVVELFLGYKEDGRNVGIYTNSPHTDRLDVLRDEGIAIAETGIGKPAFEGFMRFCDQEDMDPKHTAMIGNSGITDMPFVEEGQKPLFPLNVLTESIPPNRQNVNSWLKHYRSKLFHTICLASAKIVLLRNPNILREINLNAKDEFAGLDSDIGDVDISFQEIDDCPEEDCTEFYYSENDPNEMNTYKQVISELDQMGIRYRIVSGNGSITLYVHEDALGLIDISCSSIKIVRPQMKDVEKDL